MKDVNIDPNGVPNTVLHSKTCISLPCHPQMSDNDVQKVINSVNEY